MSNYSSMATKSGIENNIKINHFASSQAAAKTINRRGRKGIALFQQLRQVSLLSDMDEPQLIQLSGHCQLENMNKNRYVIVGNENKGRLFFLLKGSVKISQINQDGEELVIKIVDAPAYFGELSVLNNTSNTVTVARALSEYNLASLPSKNAEMLLLQTPPVAQNLLKDMAMTIHHGNAYRLILQRQSTLDRISLWLLMQVPNDHSENTYCLTSIPTQQNLAALLGTTRESISRSIAALLKMNVLKKDGRQLCITDISSLKEKVQD